MTSHSCLDLRYPSILRKVASAWDRAVNIHSSGHAHGSIDMHEDNVALLLDVLFPQIQTHKETGFECMCWCWFSFCSRQRDRCVDRCVCSVSSMCHIILCRNSFTRFLPFTFQQGNCTSPEADKSSLMVQLLGINGQINLAHLKEKLPIK